MSRDLDARLSALAAAVDLADGRLDPTSVDVVREVVARAGERLGLGVETTVAALAGPTGAGKSSLFNRLVGAEVAGVSRRRPTTSTAAAAIWGRGDERLLDWLEVPRRHRLAAARGLDGLVLLDLPDFDSTEASHRVEADRLIGLTDLVVWVVDPQKYADASWHDDHLRPLAGYAATMAVALNQADLLDAAALEACRADLARLLAAEGLPRVPILALSAVTGEGLDELRRLLAARVAAHAAAIDRLAADVDGAAALLASHCGDGRAGKLGRDERRRLLRTLEEAARLGEVVRAVDAAHRRRGKLATGWPFVRWLLRLRPDPLRRLRLPEAPSPLSRTSLPAPGAVERARTQTALRELAAAATRGLPEPWPELVRDRGAAAEDRLPDALDRAVASSDLHVTAPRWWRGVNALQLLLAAGVAAGMLWLLALALLSYLRLDADVFELEVRGVALPTALLLGGFIAGFAIALLARVVNAVGARRRARAAARSVRVEVERVANDLVTAPVEAELEAHDRLCSAVRDATR